MKTARVSSMRLRCGASALLVRWAMANTEYEEQASYACRLDAGQFAPLMQRHCTEKLGMSVRAAALPRRRDLIDRIVR